MSDDVMVIISQTLKELVREVRAIREEMDRLFGDEDD